MSGAIIYLSEGAIKQELKELARIAYSKKRERNRIDENTRITSRTRHYQAPIYNFTSQSISDRIFDHTLINEHQHRLLQCALGKLRECLSILCLSQ